MDNKDNGVLTSFGDIGQPAGLPDGIFRIPFSLNVYRANYFELGGVILVIFRQIIGSDVGIVTVAERDLWRVTEPGVVIGTYVPEVVMGV